LAYHTFDVDNPDPETRRRNRADQRQLERDARHWHTWCRIFAGWEIPPARPRVPCPNCDAEQDQGKGLRVRFDDLGTHDAPDNAAVRAAVCLSCNATWDERSIGILAEHIRQATDDTRSAGENSPTARVAVGEEIVHPSGWGEEPAPGTPRDAPHAADVGPCR